MPPRDADAARIRIVTLNWGRFADGLRDALIDLADDTDQPEVIALQEIKGWGGTIPGYERSDAHVPGQPFSRRNVTLVRQRGVRICRDTDVHVDGPSWRGPKGGFQPPRHWPGDTVEVEDDGQRWDVLNVHRAWTGLLRTNMPAYEAEHQALTAFMHRRAFHLPNRPVAMVGDWNARVGDRRRFGLQHLADATGADLLVKGIDGGVVRGCTGRAKKLDHDYGAKGHRPVVLDLMRA